MVGSRLSWMFQKQACGPGVLQGAKLGTEAVAPQGCSGASYSRETVSPRILQKHAKRARVVLTLPVASGQAHPVLCCASHFCAGSSHHSTMVR